MISFAKEQQELSLGDVIIGGPVGKNPTVCFPTILFGKKFAILNDDNKARARELIDLAFQLSKETHVPFIFDVSIKKSEQVAERLDFISQVLPETMHFCVDVPVAEVRCDVLNYCGKHNLLNRLIYNSINLGMTDSEYELLQSNTPLSSIVLAYNPKDASTDGRVDILDTGAGYTDTGLINMAKDAGVKNLLLDTGATTFGSFAAEAIRSIPVFKDKWGLPTGCAIHNTVDAWKYLKTYRKENEKAYSHCDAISDAMIIAYGADFVIPGKINNMRSIFPAVALADMFVAEGASDYFGIEVAEHHPWSKLR